MAENPNGEKTEESYIDEIDRKAVDAALDYIGKNASSAEDARKILYNYNDNAIIGTAWPTINQELINNYEFDVGKWWEQNHE